MRFPSSALFGLLVAVPVSVAFVMSPNFGTRLSTLGWKNNALPLRMSLREIDEEDTKCSRSRCSRVEQIKTFGQLLSERMDTFGAAGFRDDQNENAMKECPPSSASKKDRQMPMHAGIVKTGIQIAVVVWIFRKLKKMIGGKSKNAVDDGVVTTKEQDEALNAWTCNKCGATLFVARGKEFRYFNKNYKCYICGNSGRENFTNTREDIIERVGDDFEAIDIWDSLSKKDKKRLMKEAGGDEDKAQQMALDEANEAAGIVASEEDVAKVSETAGEAISDEILDDGDADGPAAETVTSDEPTEEAAPAADEETSEELSEGGGGGDPVAEDSESTAAEETPAPAPKPKPVPKPAPLPKPSPSPAPVPQKVEKKADEDVDDLDIWDEFD